MKKIGTITFHSPYNYGSSLQAYALQETVKKICNQDCEYKIINLRTEKQKYMYEIDNEKSYINKLIKRVLLKDYKEKYKIKNQKFEDFINNKLNVTREYKTYEELEKDYTEKMKTAVQEIDKDTRDNNVAALTEEIENALDACFYVSDTILNVVLKQS